MGNWALLTAELACVAAFPVIMHFVIKHLGGDIQMPEEPPWTPPELDEADWAFLQACWPDGAQKPSWLVQGQSGPVQPSGSDPFTFDSAGPTPTQEQMREKNSEVAAQKQMLQTQIDRAIGRQSWIELQALLYQQALIGIEVVDRITDKQILAAVADKVRWYRYQDRHPDRVIPQLGPARPWKGLIDCPHCNAALQLYTDFEGVSECSVCHQEFSVTIPEEELPGPVQPWSVKARMLDPVRTKADIDELQHQRERQKEFG